MNATQPTVLLARADAWRLPATLAAIGCLVFAVGLLVYLTDRDPSKAALVPAAMSLAMGNVFGPLGARLPSFAHTFAFSLFTAAALPTRMAPRYGACAAWFAVNLAFEVGQHPLVSGRLAELLRDGLIGGWPLSQPLARYFVHGTFDPGDVVAALLGAVVAGAVLRLAHRHGEEDHAL